MTAKHRRGLIALAIVAGIGLLCVYFAFSPAECGWFPKCTFKLLTGWDCPSCGAQRAIHAALHGNFRIALAYNPFMVVAMPYLAAAAIASVFKGNVADWIYSHLLNRTALLVYIALYCLWAVVRNMPAYHAWNPF